MFYYFNAEMKYKEPPPIYGVEWDGSSSTTWTRTDDAANFPNPNPYYSGMSGTPSSPFDNIMPWAGMVKVEDENAGTLVAIPKFFYKLDYANATEPRGLKIQISMTKTYGFRCSPAHMDRGDGQGERDVVYVGRYHCASDYKSKTGVTPTTNKTRATFRTGIHGLDSNIWQWDYATLVTIQMLYLVEFANWNTQACIGYGCGSGAIASTGLTDSMPYHTGTNVSSRTSYGQVQYRNIEDLWANVFDFCDGLYQTNQNIYVIKQPSSFSDNSNGVFVYNCAGIVGNNIKSYVICPIRGLEFVFLPSETIVDSDFSTYICDAANYSLDTGVFAIGGHFSGSQSRGLFFIATNLGLDFTSANFGSRLMKLP